MKDFFLRNKAFLGVIVVTVLLLFGGIYFFTKNPSDANTSKVKDSILVPEGAYKFTNAETSATLVEFGDYQCPACGSYHTFVAKLLEDYKGKLNFVFRNFPLTQHTNAPISSYAALAAGEQGKYWEMHNKIYESQAAWSNSTDAKTIFTEYAKSLGLNLSKFTSDIDSQLVKDKVARDMNDGNLIKINSTPTFFLNGIKLSLPDSYDEFKQMVEDALKNTSSSPSASQTSYHAHFDLKIFIGGTAVNLGLAKYQSVKGKELDPDIHLHNGNAYVVHLHKNDIPLSRLISSLKINFPKNSNEQTLKIYVNGQENPQGLSYVPQDLDQILVSYGPVTDKNITKQISSVTNNACIYSLKCPERGTPPPESCEGGLGTDCEE